MLREPLAVEHFHAPPEFLCVRDEAAAVRLPNGGMARPATMRLFARQMARQGQAVQLARLGYDRLYAFACLAQAHACDDAGLRSTALELFEAFERPAD